LAEEKNADKKLSVISKQVNMEASKVSTEIEAEVRVIGSANFRVSF
jgi:hypothetical protein